MKHALLINLEWQKTQDSRKPEYGHGPIFFDYVDHELKLNVFSEENPSDEDLERFIKTYRYNTRYLHVLIDGEDIESDFNQEQIDKAITEYEELTNLYLNDDYAIEILSNIDEIEAYVDCEDKEWDKRVEAKISASKNKGRIRFSPYASQSPNEMSRMLADIYDMAHAMQIPESDIECLANEAIEYMHTSIRRNLFRHMDANKHIFNSATVPLDIVNKMSDDITHVILNSGVDFK